MPALMVIDEAAVPLPAEARIGFHPDDTTPIPRPSRYYGRRRNELSEHFRGERQAGNEVT